MAKARGLGFNSLATTKIFFTFSLCFSLDPFKWESFNLVHMKSQNLIINIINVSLKIRMLEIVNSILYALLLV